MRVNIDALKKSAEESTKWRGHVLGKWRKSGRGAFAFCTLCHKAVTVLTNPKPNEIDISGEAVALNCGDKE